MRKIISLFLAVFMILGMLNLNFVFALGGSNDISVTYNGNKILFDQPPVIVEGRTLVPLRAIFEALGADVEWDAETKQIMAFKDDTTVLMTVDSTVMTSGTIGGTAKDTTLDVAPMIINERTMIPARAIAEAFECSVEWDNEIKTVKISGASSNSKESINNSITATVNEPTNEKVTIPAYVESTNEKVFKNNLTNMNSTSYNTQVAYPSACCAYIDNGTVYYSFIYQPTIYAYDGSNTVEYNSGGAPSGIVVTGNKIYYLNENDNKICSIDLITGRIEILFSKLSSINSFLIYNGFMYISGSCDGNCQIYHMDLSNNSSSMLYSYENSKATAKLLTAGDGRLYFITNYDKLAINSLSLSNGKTSKVLTLSGSTVNHLVDKENIYVTDSIYIGRSSSGERMYDNTYYIIYTSNGKYKKLSEKEYNEKHSFDMRADGINDGWDYKGENSSITRINKKNGDEQTLIASNSSEKYNYLTNDLNTVVFWSGDVNSKLVAKADQYSGAIYGALSHKTLGYKSANMYVMNTDGSNVRLINSYSSQTGSSPSVNSGLANNDTSVPSSQTCVICHGSGSVTCSYCHGSGVAISASIGLGGHVSEGVCPSCGGSGKKVCTVCNGTGVTYNR